MEELIKGVVNSLPKLVSGGLGHEIVTFLLLVGTNRSREIDCESSPIFDKSTVVALGDEVILTGEFQGPIFIFHSAEVVAD